MRNFCFILQCPCDLCATFCILLFNVGNNEPGNGHIIACLTCGANSIDMVFEFSLGCIVAASTQCCAWVRWPTVATSSSRRWSATSASSSGVSSDLYLEIFPLSLFMVSFNQIISSKCCTSAFYSFELSNNQYVLPIAIMLLSTTACGVDLVYWMLWLMLGKLVLVGHFELIYWIPFNEVANFILPLTLHIRVMEYGMSIIKHLGRTEAKPSPHGTHGSSSTRARGIAAESTKTRLKVDVHDSR